MTATVLGLSGCGGDEEEPAAEPAATAEREEPAVGSDASPAEEAPVTVELQEQNDSGQSGEATRTAEGEKTRVVLDLQSVAPSLTTAKGIVKPLFQVSEDAPQLT